MRTGYGAYICGEETALLESLEGKKGQPRFKPPFPASFGLYGKPTTINNTETFASVPWIIRNGGEWFLELGKPNNGGTKLFSVSGHVNRPGNFEVPPRHAVQGSARDGRRHARRAQAQGGDPGRLVDAGAAGRRHDGMHDMDYDSIAKAGSMLGSGAVIVMDETTCMVKALERLSYFYFEESCGQCTPCREGTGWLYRMVHRIEHGEGGRRTSTCSNSVADNIMGRTICALGDAAALPVQELPQALPARIRIPHRAQAAASSRVERAARGQRAASWNQHRANPMLVNLEIDGKKPVQVPKGSMVMDAADRSASTCRISATTRSCRSPPTAACAWCRSRRRRSRCRPARRRSPTA
jgi:NADH:ubiquinone oxidoreductase subunit F (NADH-binding)